MATTDDTPDRNNSHGRTSEEVQKLEQLVGLFEAIDWRQVEGITVAESATLGEKLANARQRTISADGGL